MSSLLSIVFGSFNFMPQLETLSGDMGLSINSGYVTTCVRLPGLKGKKL